MCIDLYIQLTSGLIDTPFVPVEFARRWRLVSVLGNVVVPLSTNRLGHPVHLWYAWMPCRVRYESMVSLVHYCCSLSDSSACICWEVWNKHPYCTWRNRYISNHPIIVNQDATPKTTTWPLATCNNQIPRKEYMGKWGFELLHFWDMLVPYNYVPYVILVCTYVYLYTMITMFLIWISLPDLLVPFRMVCLISGWHSFPRLMKRASWELLDSCCCNTKPRQPLLFDSLMSGACRGEQTCNLDV